ncbi:hypothetical protein AVEN_125237-1 [Araneus ventricosus]|uniref:Uncharacterized protein n=1 Tax=Araneus ventricosus TaxID=182803 RepID=A0A4Y2M2F5_ARAVE|nr:hypothetical protein AVEN_125237-1 [Araneus ventricosus]
MRSCRISKQVLASLMGTIMVMWLFGPISEDRSYPGKTGVSSHEQLVMRRLQCLTMVSWRPVFDVDRMPRQGRVMTFVIPKGCNPLGGHREFIDQKQQYKQTGSRFP